jgi:hypothetical protein
MASVEAKSETELWRLRRKEQLVALLDSFNLECDRSTPHDHEAACNYCFISVAPTFLCPTPS